MLKKNQEKGSAAGVQRDSFAICRCMCERGRLGGRQEVSVISLFYLEPGG